MLGAQVLEGNVFADIAVQHELDTGRFQIVRATLDNVFFKLEARNAVHQKAANAVITVVDGHFIAFAAQLFSRGKASRTRTDNANALRALARRCDWLDPTFFPGRVSNVFFNGTNGDCTMPRLLGCAATLTQTVLRANTTADFRHVVRRRRYLIGFFKAAVCREHQPVRNIVSKRAVFLTERHAAL